MAHAKMMQRAVARMTAYANDNFLPDVCKIKRRGTFTGTDVYGAAVYTADTYLTYRGSDNIPIRVDVSRGLRPDRFPAQPLVADEYYAYLPLDLSLVGEDIVEYKGLEPMKIKKLMSSPNAWDVLQEVLLSRFE